MAIVLTLVYLALQTQQLTMQNQQLVVQTQQNTEALRSAAIQDISRWSYDTAVLSYHGALLRLMANRYYQSELGFIDRDTLMALGGRGPAYNSPIFAEIWSEIRHQFDEKFQQFIDDEILVLVEESC